MAPPQEPQSLTARVRRLELLLLALLVSSGDELDDDDLWFEYLRLFRRGIGRERPDSPEFEYLIERLLDRRRRSQPPSILRQLDGLRDEVQEFRARASNDDQALSSRLEQVRGEVQRLRSDSQAVKIETHALLAIQALGLPADAVQLTRYVPVRAYIDETPDGAIAAISASVAQVLAAFGFDFADEFPEIKGSWFKKWFARSKDVLSQPEVKERLEKIERAVELKGIDRPQAEVDEKQASAIAKLVKALDKVPNAAVQAGSVLVVKLTTPKGPVIQARTLTQEEMVELENNQLLLQDPAEVLGRLSAACTQNKRLPPPPKPLTGEA